MIHQIEVRFRAPLRGASRIDADAAPPVVPLVAVPTAAVEVRPEPPPPPVTLWETEIGQELARDRELIGATLSRLTDTLRALDERQRQRLAEWQRAAIELGVTIAARLLHDNIRAGEMAIDTVVREAVALLKPDEAATVRLHPLDLALLQNRLGDEPLFPNRANVQVIAEASLSRGDCRVEGKDTSILSEVGVQLVAMRQRLLESLEHAQPGS